MNGSCENMDDICEKLKECVAWLEASKTPALFFAGMTPVLQFINPPAPNMEMTFIEKGSVESLRIGDKVFTIPERCFSVHGLRFGNFSPPKKERGRAWCAIFSAEGAPESLTRSASDPFFVSGLASNPCELASAFLKLRRLCAMQGYEPQAYTSSHAMFNPLAKDCGEGLKLQVKAALLELFGLLLDSAEHGSDNRKRRGDGPVEAALRVIEADYAKRSLTLGTLARKACLSEDHLGRAFKAKTGMSPMAYAQYLRLREAAALLRETGDRIKRIARAVGYDDPLYFSRLFRKEFKASPKSFREGKAPFA